jgi:hypothetical protein
LNVVLQGVARSTTATSGEVRRRPEHAFAIACCQVRSLLSTHSAGHALERVHQMGYRDFRRIVDEQMDVMILAVPTWARLSYSPHPLDKFRLEVGANLGEPCSESVDGAGAAYEQGHKLTCQQNWVLLPTFPVTAFFFERSWLLLPYVTHGTSRRGIRRENLCVRFSIDKPN